MTNIDFVAGFDLVCPVPKIVKKAELGFRFAVIQSTYVVGCEDMHFDESLWERLVAFAKGYCYSGEVVVVQREGKKETPIDVFLADWRKSTDNPAERELPQFILVRNQGALVLCIATEIWARVGGPEPYADSYTYSFYSKEDIGQSVIGFLAEGNEPSQWQMSAEPIIVSPRHSSGLWGRVLKLLGLQNGFKHSSSQG